ncbi:MAG: hypothetical protein IT317_17195 [Anaerolineales bacterium]|nr:hypothetical protein [Anaerolineales bacterium]
MTMIAETQTTTSDTEAQRVRLALAAAEAAPEGGFAILAITAGEANGWRFAPEVLRASLPLWECVETFVDHGALATSGRSVRDLGGVCSDPAWDEARQGITLALRPAGPSGPLVAALGRELLAAGQARPRVGFSADLLFTPGPGRTVARLLRVLSLDLVFDPARGGAFLRALNSVGAGVDQKGDGMTTETAVTQAPGPDVAAPQTAAAEQLAGYLLESALSASRLPGPAQAVVRRRFGGRAFAPGELTAAIDEQRALVAALTAGAVVQGPGRVTGLLDSADRLQAAVDDLFQVPREAAAQTAHVARLSGVRELYHLLTGDYDFHGGVYPERLALQHTTANFTGLVKNAMNKAIVERWNQLGRAGYGWWEKLVHVEHFETLNQVTWVITGSVGALPAIAEGAEYPELKVGDSPETASFTKYGGYIGLTLETLDRDDVRQLRAIPRELASAALRRLSGLVAAIFTDNSGAGPSLADGGALFNSTATTTAGGHKNLLTTALSAAEWEVVRTAVYNQPLLVANESGYYGTGAKLALNPRYVLVPRALELTAKQIIYPTLERAATIYSENQQRGEPGDVLVVPEWSDANDWAAVVDPALAPAICVGERFGLRPEVFVAGDELSPAVFMNDESRIKVRHLVAVGVADYRPLHKSNV